MSGQPITMRYEKSEIEFLKKEARKISFQENKTILYTDLIREAIRNKYPKIDKETKNEK